MAAPFKQFAAMLRLFAALNGLAALSLMAFSLGILGADVDAPDLSEPLQCFLGGLGCSALALVLAGGAQLWREHRVRRSLAPGGLVAMSLAAVAFVGAVAGFCMGCWMASSYDTSSSAQTGTSQASDVSMPSLPRLAQKIVSYQ